MRLRALLIIGGVCGSVGIAVGLSMEALYGADDSTTVGYVAAGLAIVVLLAVAGFVAGWFGRERDDVFVAAVGAGLVAAVALLIASVLDENVAVGAVILAGGVAIAGGIAGATTWWIGEVICDARDLPTARRLVAPAYAKENPGYPMWTTDAGPAIRATLDQLADRVAAGDSVDGRAVGIVPKLPRDVPVVVLLAGDRLMIQPIDINGSVNGDLRTLRHDDITHVATRSVKADGTVRQINAYDDVITIGTSDGSHTRLRLPYGTRAVGTSTGGSDVIREWLTARSTVDR